MLMSLLSKLQGLCLVAVQNVNSTATSWCILWQHQEMYNCPFCSIPRNKT